MTEQQEAVDLLYANIGSIPHPEYGHINLMPFAASNDQVNALKRQVCEGLVGILSDAGLLARKDAPAVPLRSVTVKCRLCSTHLVTFASEKDGTANIPAAAVIESLAKRRVECPHDVMTAEDQRLMIEEAVKEMQAQ